MLFKKKDKKISESMMGLKVGSLVEIGALDDKYLVNAYQSKLIEILPDDEISVLVPKNKTNMVKLPVNKEYNIVFKTENGLLKSTVRVVGYLLDNKIPLIKLKVIEEMIKIQRRASFRLTVNLPMEFDVVPDKSDATLKDDDVLLSKGETIDISSGGIKFCSNEDINENDYIKILIKTKEVFLVAIGTIIFKKDLKTLEGYQYEYKCKFENIPKKFVEDISKYIFEKQRDLSKKGRI